MDGLAVQSRELKIQIAVAAMVPVGVRAIVKGCRDPRDLPQARLHRAPALGGLIIWNLPRVGSRPSKGVQEVVYARRMWCQGYLCCARI